MIGTMVHQYVLRLKIYTIEIDFKIHRYQLKCNDVTLFLQIHDFHTTVTSIIYKCIQGTVQQPTTDTKTKLDQTAHAINKTKILFVSCVKFDLKKENIYRTILSLTICSISAKSADVPPSSDFSVKLETCRMSLKR